MFYFLSLDDSLFSLVIVTTSHKILFLAAPPSCRFSWGYRDAETGVFNLLLYPRNRLQCVGPLQSGGFARRAVVQGQAMSRRGRLYLCSAFCTCFEGCHAAGRLPPFFFGATRVLRLLPGPLGPGRSGDLPPRDPRGPRRLGAPPASIMSVVPLAGGERTTAGCPTF